MTTSNSPEVQGCDVLTLATPEPYFIDQAWKENGLPKGIETRLVRIDKALHGLDGVISLLTCNQQNKQLVEVSGGVAYDNLSTAMEDQLQCAQATLLDIARQQMEELRDTSELWPKSIRIVKRD